MVWWFIIMDHSVSRRICHFLRRTQTHKCVVVGYHLPTVAVPQMELPQIKSMCFTSVDAMLWCEEKKQYIPKNSYVKPSFGRGNSLTKYPFGLPAVTFSGVPTPWINVFPFFTLPKSTQTIPNGHFHTFSNILKPVPFLRMELILGGWFKNCVTEGTSEFSWILNSRLGHLVSENPARLHPWSSGSFTHQWYQQKNNVERRSLRDGHSQKRLYIV